MRLDFDQQFATAPVALALEVDVSRPAEELWDQLIAVGRWRTWYRGVAFAHVRGDGPLLVGSRVDWRVDGWRVRSLIVEMEAPLRLTSTLQTLGGHGALRWTITPAASGIYCVRLEECWGGVAVAILRRTLRKTLRVSRAAWLEGLVASS